MKKLWFDLVDGNGVSTVGFGVENNCVIGWAGRDMEKTMEHIRELESIGVPAPRSIPTIYPVSPVTLTQEPVITCMGDRSCGEVEFIIFKRQGQIYVGIGSDHTDRELESLSVLKSKAICEKPVGKILWRYEEIKDHWDELEMTAWQVVDGEERLYQQGTAAALLPLETLVRAAESAFPHLEDCVIFSGTVPTVAGMVYGSRFRACIQDTKLGRALELAYDVKVVPCE